MNKSKKPEIYLTAEAVGDLIVQITANLKAKLQVAGVENPVLIGIHTGGAWLAERLHQELQLEEPQGTLDISFYRDDFTRIGMNPKVKPSQIPLSIDNRHIVLVDDVLQTGRTIRAAMNEIFDYGRPASILLVTLVERGTREIPIQPNVVGIRSNIDRDQKITLTGPSPLELVIGDSKALARQLML